MATLALSTWLALVFVFLGGCIPFGLIIWNGVRYGNQD